MLKTILKEFLSIEGVTTAALIGRDGFVIEVVQNHSSDLDELGALCSGSMSFFERNGALLKMGSVRQIIFEHRDGIILLTPLTTQEFLIIITNTNTGLGHLAYSLATISSRVAAVI